MSDLSAVTNPFFDHPILNSPYDTPKLHWELDEDGKPTQKTLQSRRPAQFITPIPKPKKRKKAQVQEGFVFDEGAGLYDQDQQYDPTSATNQVRGLVASWRSLPNRNQWQVTPETARLLQHWRHQKFSGVRPFFCQVEAVETAIWLTGVAPQSKAGKGLPDQLAAANQNANYRTPYQIRAQADRLLGPTVTDVDGISETRNDTISVFNGPPPTILSFKTEAEEIAAVGEWMAAVIALGSLGHVKYVLSVSLQACQSSPSRGASGGLAGA